MTAQPPKPTSKRQLPTGLKERLREAYAWRSLRFVLAVNTAIAAASFLSSLTPGRSVVLTAAVSLFFSHAIGHTIYLLCAVNGNFERWRPLYRFPALLATFVLGGWLGAFWALLLIEPLFGLPLGTDYLGRILGSHSIAMVILCFLIWIYAALYERLQETAARLAAREVDAQRLERLKTRAELEALQARINPHFLFNTLNSIASLIPVDPVRAEDMVQRLSDLFRYTLDASGRQTVTLAAEVQAVRQYLEIEKVRLGPRLQYAIEVAPDVEDTPLPGLLLQPLVENSIKHGIAPLAQGGRVEIRCRREGDAFVVRIRDTGPGLSPDNDGDDGFGLHSVRERLDLHYGTAYRFDLTDGDGVTATLRLPLAQTKPAQTKPAQTTPNQTHTNQTKPAQTETDQEAPR